MIKEVRSENDWEAYIREHSPVALFQSWSWGEIVEKAWRLGNFSEDKLTSVAQVAKIDARRGRFLHIRHGPILSSWDRESLSIWVDYFISLAKKERANFIRMSPLIPNTEYNERLFKDFHFRPSPIHAMDGEYCWVLNVDKSEEELLSGMRKTTRYLIRQAEKIGVKIEKSKNPKDLEDFMTLYEMTASRHGFTKHTGIVDEFMEFLKKDQILLFKGYFDKKLLSAALILFYNNQAVYHHSASVDQKIPVNYLLQWEAIKEARKRNKKIYNFWGIAPTDRKTHPWYGLSLFKKGFGGHSLEYMHAHDLPVNRKYLITLAVESFRKIKKRY
ncbi:hypothetical protein A3D77_02230 [Candidatus Gottesmanbacteria bacterium RIFCSPHIGHO2_02_FULL_39_11]|uniref:BioF2-like acetyltransferase domain-containing protein n=1 Tax=Candidatus Gottesmanbacteria bacterium RIFCSPHIGHO2_02_FULL_39_11 TaxID=1798382 RepID=A0A1F5ZVA1_9BACT|nr:MAG: hypothetical protein A3D77_02230 [Candidatus Gottesmanbacteria bacterium RIFCSPHIGHO2_02_FULL_39_11]